jgi:hypothetical protein
LQKDENKRVGDSIFGTSYWALIEDRKGDSKLWKGVEKLKAASLCYEKRCGLGRLCRESGLEVKLQSELQNARIANGAGKNSERGRPESSIGGSEVRMIEHVEGLRTEREAVFFRD